MKKKLIKLFIALCFMIFAGVELFAENAVVTYVKGKVEVLRNDKWIQLEIGDSIFPSETVSTGFQSEVKIKYNGSVLGLGAVTRITIDELSKVPGKETVNLNLSTGAVRSKVTHADDTRVSYTVRSPVAVASVRGTDFMITDSGSVTCFEGAVVVYSVKQDKKRKSAQKIEEAEEESEESSEEESAAEESSAEGTAENGNSESEGESSSTETAVASDEAPGAYGPATATTSAAEIAEDAPTGAVVVGANQTTTFNSSGNPDKPMDTAEKEATKAKSYGQTASEKESVSAGSSVDVPVTTTVKAPEEIQKGSISVTVQFAD